LVSTAFNSRKSLKKNGYSLRTPATNQPLGDKEMELERGVY
jgi:hypothetical protein